MKKKRRTNAPITVNEDVWFYVNDKTLEFVVWTRGTREHPRQVRQFRIPFSKLRPHL
jgi:hypothetical protein